MTRSRSDIIVAYGDSQTAGFSWGNKLVELSGGKIKRAINRGASGQSSGTIGIRQGGVELSLLTENVTISGVAPVDVQFQASIAPCNNRTPSIPGEFGGVRGVFTIVTPNAPEGRPSGTFTADVAPAIPVSVGAGDKFVPEDVLDHPEYGEYLHIIWAGGNDRAYNGANAAPGTVLAAKAQVERLRTFVDEPLFLVAGPTVYSSEVEGTTGHTRALQARDQLAQEFPDNFVNIWEHVRDNGLDILGISPTAEDDAAIAGKSMPPSLTADNIHFSTAVREGVIAPFILDAMLSRGWLDGNPGGGSGMAEYDPTVWKNKPSTETPLSAANLNKIEAGIVSAVAAANDASEAASGLVSEMESKANTDAVNTALAGKLDRTGTKTVDGATTFSGAATFNGPSAFVGSTRFGGKAVADNVTASDTTEQFTRFNTTSKAMTFQLAAGVQGGRRYIVGRSYQGSNTLSILPPDGGTINGSADPYVIQDQGEMVEVVSLGSGGAWHVVAHRGGPAAPVTWADVTGKPTIPAATPAGTRAQLDAGTDTTVRAFSAKDIADYVTARLAEPSVE